MISYVGIEASLKGSFEYLDEIKIGVTRLSILCPKLELEFRLTTEL